MGMGEWVLEDKEKPVGKVLILFGEPFFGKCTAEIDVGYYNEEQQEWRFWLSEKKVLGYGVTHWMRLPQLPDGIDKIMMDLENK